MIKIIRQITPQCRVLVQGKAYRPLAKSIYATVACPDEPYAKIFFAGKRVLVIPWGGAFVYFGKEVSTITREVPPPARLFYEGTKYRRVAHDYQVVLSLEFGAALAAEGEVMFWDYNGVVKKNMFLSLGIVQRTGKRADVAAVLLQKNEISLKA
jgi:hypothetical protein